MVPPTFVKGDLAFTMDGQRLVYARKKISIYGVNGLSWGKLKYTSHFGIPVLVDLLLHTDPETSLRTRGHLTREEGLSSHFMGVRFLLSSEHHETLKDSINRFGFTPADYQRKFPRIPSDEMIQIFPLRASVHFGTGANAHAMVMDVVNLSPNGVMLRTENPNALSLRPGAKMDISLEPRGWFPTTIHGQASVCRVTDDLHPTNGNTVRYFGLQLLGFDDSNRAAFQELLKSILEQLKTEGQTPRPTGS